MCYQQRVSVDSGKDLYTHAGALTCGVGAWRIQGYIFTNVYCTDVYCTDVYCTNVYCTDMYCTDMYCTDVYCTGLYNTIELSEI